MGLMFWKKTKDIDAFAHSIADDLYSHVGPDSARDFTFGASTLPKKQQLKIQKKLADVVVQIARFSKANSLGIYGKARLQQTFNARLGELGYPTEVVDKLSESILLQNT